MNQVPIYHFLREVTREKDGHATKTFEVRYVTSIAPTKWLNDYNESLITRRPSGSIFAIRTGTWRFRLLEQLLDGKNWTLTVTNNDDIDTERLVAAIAGATYAWANAKYTFMLTIEGESWGLGALGIEVDSLKKTSKRLQEIARMSEAALFIPDVDGKFDISFSFPEVDGPEEMYDGKTYVSENLIRRMALTIDDEKRRGRWLKEMLSGEGTLRLLAPMGMLKGNYVVVKSDVDITTDLRGFKTEIRTNGYIHITLWKHELAHLAVWDDQSSANFRKALPESAQKNDILRMRRNLEDVLAKGELPEWLLMSEPGHDDAGVPAMENLSFTVSQAWKRWQMDGRNIAAAQNFTHMGFNGVLERMKTPKQNGYHKKMWVPMSNAMLLSINTYESATRMGGLAFPGRNRNVSFFDPRAGLIMPGKRFVETYALHGGWDLDDSVKVIKILVWSSTVEAIELHAGKTISRDFPIPMKKEDAKLMALFVRSPNGPGEYSIEEFDFDGFPLPDDLAHDNITVVDLAEMREPQMNMLERVTINGMPTSMVYSGEEFTPEDAVTMILAQKKNPSIGRFCNAMLVWSTVNDAYPAEMLDKMETIVDASQQGADIASFEAIEVAPTEIYSQLIALDVKVDAAIASTRLPASVRKELVKYQGPEYRVQKMYMETIDFIKGEIHDKTMQWRLNEPLVQRILARPFDINLRTRAQRIFNKYVPMLKEIDRVYEVKDDMAPFKKMNTAQAKKLAMEELVDEMVAKFMALEQIDRYRLVMTLYKLVLTPIQGSDPLGQSDRIIFQASATGKMNVMDILLEALNHFGY